MSGNALALRIKKISGGKGDASKVKMLTFYYALKAAGLFSLASFALGRMQVMDKVIFSELTLDLGLSDGIENNQIENDGVENNQDEDIKIEINENGCYKTENNYLIQNEIGDESEFKTRNKGIENDDENQIEIEIQNSTESEIKIENGNKNEDVEVDNNKNTRKSKRKR
jgi:hypothetical protein